MKKILGVILVIFISCGMVSCRKDISKEEGYKKYQDMGIEFIKDGVWNEFDDNLVLGGLGDSEDEENPVYSGLEYGFISNELIAEYYKVAEIENPEEKSAAMNEIFAQVKGLHKIYVLRKELLPDGDEMEDITGCVNNEKIGKAGKYVFYFSYDEYDDSNLSEEAMSGYKALFDDIINFKKKIQIFEPVTPEDAMANLGKVEFKLMDLFGEEVNSQELFEDNKVTMINIWGTFCGPCIREMPDLQEIHLEMKDKEFGILGIIGDTPDEDNEVIAKELYESKKITFKSIIPDKDMKDGLIKNIAGYPTSIFVDSEGNIIGDVITGSRSKEEYMEIIQEVIESIK